MALPVTTDAQFETDVIQSPVPVVVDFGATWCGPCKALKPILEDLSKTYGSRVKMVYVDADQSQKTAVRFSVTSLPTVVLVKGGRERSRIVGLRSKGDIAKQIDAVLAAS